MHAMVRPKSTGKSHSMNRPQYVAKAIDFCSEEASNYKIEIAKWASNGIFRLNAISGVSRL
jgi:hypothetical protein